MNSRRPDPRAVLGVPADASAEEIRTAYRRLLRRHHPDTRDGGDGRSNASGESATHEATDADSASELRDILDAYAELRAAAERPSRPSDPVEVVVAAPDLVVLPTRWWRL